DYYCCSFVGTYTFG
nr:immunoglobulin light chain junction region [Macaca mulatta]